MNDFSNYNEQRGFDWGSFIAGVLLIIASIMLFRHPGVALRTFALLFAILSIVQGIVWLAIYSRFRDFMNYSWVTIIAGVLDIIVGVLFLYSYDAAGLTLGYLFAIWFLFDSLAGLVFGWHLRHISTFYFVFSLIMDVISLILAISLLFNPMLSVLTLVWLIAVWLLIYGINEIVIAFAHR